MATQGFPGNSNAAEARRRRLLTTLGLSREEKALPVAPRRLNPPEPQTRSALNPMFDEAANATARRERLASRLGFDPRKISGTSTIAERQAALEKLKEMGPIPVKKFEHGPAPDVKQTDYGLGGAESIRPGRGGLWEKLKGELYFTPIGRTVRGAAKLVNKPLAPVGQDYAAIREGVEDDPEAWVKNSLTDLGQVTADVVEGLSTPVNLAILTALAVAPPAGLAALGARLVSLGFSWQLAAGAGQELSEGLSLAKQGHHREAARKLGSAGVHTLLALLAGKHGAKPAPARGRPQPEVKLNLAEAGRTIIPPPPTAPLLRALPPGPQQKLLPPGRTPSITPPPPDASFVRGVPAKYPAKVPREVYRPPVVEGVAPQAKVFPLAPRVAERRAAAPKPKGAPSQPIGRAATSAAPRLIPTESVGVDLKRFQPRLGMQEGRVQVIAESMRERGYDPTEPLTVWVDSATGQPLVLSGHHRLAAAQRAKVSEVPVQVFEGTEAEAIAFARRSNSRMAKLSPIEEARAFAREVQEGRSTQEIAKEYGGIKQSLVEDRLALNNLPPELQLRVQDGTFRSPLATALGKSAGKHGLSPEIQVQIFDRVVKSMEVTPNELSRIIDTIAPRAQENIQMGLGFNLERGFVEPLMEMTRTARELQRAKRRFGGFLKQVDEYRKSGKPIPKNLERARGAAQAEIRRLGKAVQDLDKSLALERKPTMKQAFKGAEIRPQPPIESPPLTERVSRERVFGESRLRPQKENAAEALGSRSRGTTEPKFPDEAKGPEGQANLYSNPAFDPRFWRQADKFVSRTFTQKIDRALESTVGRLPISIRKWLREEPRTKQIIQEARREVGQHQNETESVLRMVLREKPTPEELVVADRIARGVPEDLTKARPEVRPVLKKAAQQIQGMAQQMTSERAALGLPIREEWLNAPKVWYPNLWSQHIIKPRMVAGRLFSKLRPSKPETGSLRARTTDRYTVVDGSGKLARTKTGQAIFKTMEEAREFVKEHPRRKLRIVEPMTHEQAVAHGLIEDLALNLHHGFGKEWSLLAKTRALETIGKEFVSPTPRPGYVNLGKAGFNVPVELAKRNVHIAGLRDGYIPQEVATTLTAFYGKSGALRTAYRAVEGSLRKWVTVRNPFRHPRQILENELTLAFADTRASLNLPARLRAFRDFARGSRGERNVPFWDEYASSNLWHSDIVRGEFEVVWRGVDSVKAGEAPLSLRERMAIWAEKDPAAKQLMAADKFAERLYRAEDQIYKFYLYRTLRQRGLSPKQAENRTSRSFFDYSDVPPIVRATNRFIPFAPNVLYQFSRILGTALRDRPVSTSMKLALLVYGYAFMREEFMRDAGITEQDEKVMGELAPELHELVLPITDSKGRNIKVSLLWLLPYADLFMLDEMFSSDDPERGSAILAHRLVPMVGQPAVTLGTSRRSFGQPFLTGKEPKAEADRKRATEFFKGFMPGLLGQYWERLYRNAQAGERTKKPLAEKALLEPITGRIEHFYPKERVGLRKAIIRGKTSEVSGELYRQRGRLIRGQTTGETYRKAIESLEKRLREVAHAETLAVIEAFRRGDREAGREAYDRLLQTGYYPTKEEANKAIDQLAALQSRLAYAKKSQLPEIIAMADRAIDEYRETGPLHPLQIRRLNLAVASLSKSEQDALRNWMEEQIEIAREGRVQPPPAFTIPREKLYAPRY